MSGADYERSHGPRGDDFGADDRTWMDRRAEERMGPYAGRGPRGWSPSDEKIREAVSEALMEDRLLDAREIEVLVDGGVVTLKGEVPGASDIHHAEDLARGCSGVTDVRLELEVHGRPRRPLSLHRDQEQPNPFHPPGQDHAVTADQRNAALGRHDGGAH